MTFPELLTVAAIGIGLSIDTFSVSAAEGTTGNKSPKLAVFLALLFGAFHTAMPIAGYFAGEATRKIITNFDHWIAFLLLVYVGGKMVLDQLFPDEEKSKKRTHFSIRNDLRTYLSLAVATSIDALAIGITFAFLGLPIIESALIIGGTTAIVSFAGVYVGRVFGSALKKKAGIIGGLVLIAIGLKILVEHLLFS